MLRHPTENTPASVLLTERQIKAQQAIKEAKHVLKTRKTPFGMDQPDDERTRYLNDLALRQTARAILQSRP